MCCIWGEKMMKEKTVFYRIVSILAIGMVMFAMMPRMEQEGGSLDGGFLKLPYWVFIRLDPQTIGDAIGRVNDAPDILFPPYEHPGIRPSLFFPGGHTSVFF